MEKRASAALAAAYIRQGTGWLTLFYEPMNWIPFLAYFIAGAVCGYVQLKNSDTICFLRQEKKLLLEKYGFMKILYQDVVKEKRELKKQILGSRDSFGKIFDITRQLDSVKPEEVFLTAVQIMEEVLENRTISIYSVEKQKRFARLQIASVGIRSALSKTIELKEYEEMIETIGKQKVWVNTKVKADMPMYAAGIYRESELTMFIMIQEAAYSQMTLYYQNLLQILCGLVETALLRAFNYQEAMREKHYLKGTDIMRESCFREKLKLYRRMWEEKSAEYTILEIERENETLAEVWHKLNGKIRENDTLGMLSDDALYLLLAQTSFEEAQTVTNTESAFITEATTILN